MNEPQYRRVVMKLSGEALMGEESFGISPDMIQYVGDEILSVCELGVELAVVVGGGNIFRGIGAHLYGMDRTPADHMGMLATVINSLALQAILEKKGLQTRVMTAIGMHAVAEPYISRRAVRHLEKGRVVIFAAGTGNPYFTTDTAAVLRAQEVHAQVLMKATKVDGLYDCDPAVYQEANFIEEISYQKVIENHFNVMDMTAISLAMDNRLPLIVFNLRKPGSMRRLVCGECLGSRISAD